MVSGDLKEEVMSLTGYAGKPSFSKKQADLFFPPDFADDFPVAMQVCNLLMLLICIDYILYYADL